MRKKFWITVACLFGAVFFGCGRAHYSNQKADDAISRAIYEKMGGKEVYYQGKEIMEDETICYEYLMYKEQENQLTQMIEAVNEVIQQEDIEDSILLICCVPIPGGDMPVLALSNFSAGDQNVINYTKMQSLEICGSDIRVSTIYNNPATYSGLQEIQYLEISGEMARITEKEGIDWHEYWPDLQTLEIISEEK